jgi:hypothetical protein
MAFVGHQYTEVPEDSPAGSDVYSAARFSSDTASVRVLSDGLYALPTSSLGDYPVPDFDPTQFFGAFWTPDGQHNIDDGFEELKKYLRQGNEFCKDIVDIMKERFLHWISFTTHTRASIEDMYARKLQALHARSSKVAENTFG